MWYIDSGCSCHMTGNRAFLTNYVELAEGTVNFGNLDNRSSGEMEAYPMASILLEKYATLKAWAIIFFVQVSFMIMGI